MPDHFVIVGAQRSGTTYLYGLLDEHPEIEMARPVRPEPKFFLDYERYALGRDAYEAQLFPDADGARAGREEHELHRVRDRGPPHRGDAPGRARDRGRARSRTAGDVELPLQRATRRGGPRARRRAPPRRGGRPRVGPRALLGLAVRLPRARPLRGVPRALHAARLPRPAARARVRGARRRPGRRGEALRAVRRRRRLPTLRARHRGEPGRATTTPPNPSSKRGCATTSAEPNRRLADFLGRALPWAN